jgi:hypothetical protein
MEIQPKSKTRGRETLPKQGRKSALGLWAFRVTGLPRLLGSSGLRGSASLRWKSPGAAGNHPKIAGKLILEGRISQVHRVSLISPDLTLNLSALCLDLNSLSDLPLNLSISLSRLSLCVRVEQRRRKKNRRKRRKKKSWTAVHRRGKREK